LVIQTSRNFADCLGVSVSTISRWENGIQVQQSFYDDILRAFFACVEFRHFMAIRHGLQPNGPVPAVGAGTSMVQPVTPVGFASIPTECGISTQ
jgi:hypothetical protein